MVEEKRRGDPALSSGSPSFAMKDGAACCSPFLRRPSVGSCSGGPATNLVIAGIVPCKNEKIPFDNLAALPPNSRMVAVNSTMLPLGTKAPDFTLPDSTGKKVSLSDFKGAKALMIVFMCNHCPYVKHLRSGLAQLARDYASKGVTVLGISSNDVENYPADSPAKMAEEAKGAGYIFPYLYDGTQAVAKDYRAACTPDFYLFDQDQRLVYRGQFDDSRPGNGLLVTGKDLRAAIDAVLSGKPVSATQKPSIGCNIKWKPGNEPDYFA
jgi:peroxiredoxin